MFSDNFISILQSIFVHYLVIINSLGFISMGIDKFKAKNRLWRIREKSLFLIALLGGSLGSIIGMYFFRHKTKHLYFTVGMPVILITQLFILGLIK